VTCKSCGEFLSPLEEEPGVRCEKCATTRRRHWTDEITDLRPITQEELGESFRRLLEMIDNLPEAFTTVGSLPRHPTVEETIIIDDFPNPEDTF